MKNLDSSQNSRNKFVKEIYNKYYKALYPLALGSCLRYGMDPTYADDLMQQLHMSLLCKYEMVKKGYEEVGYRYLVGILQKGILDLHRKKKSFLRIDGIFAQGMPQKVNIYSMCIDMYTEEFMMQLENLLDKTSFEIMRLYILGFRYQEIAEELKINENTVATRIRRSKQKLSKHFDRKDKKMRKLFK